MAINTPGLVGEGIGLGLAIAAPIGPVNIEIIRRGLRNGFLPALLVGCGSTAADLFYVVLVYLGVAPLARQPFFRIPLNAAAAAVLGMLAWKCYREARGLVSLPPNDGIREADSGRSALTSGFLITLTNPMTIVFYFSLFGGAVARMHDAPKSAHLLYVGCVILGCLLWSLLLAMLLGWGKKRMGVRAVQVIGAASALALAYFAVRFLLEGLIEAGELLGRGAAAG
jgi:threonine/homoserine/homoserine lactone efflux protein